MMMHAYNDVFLDDAMSVLGEAVEYAVLCLKMDGQEFLDLFCASGIALEFGKGNTLYLSGMSGSELSYKILDRVGYRHINEFLELEHIDYPKEYWVGWILAYYQWKSGLSFEVICDQLKYNQIINMYGVLHEADPDKAFEVFNDAVHISNETSLAKIRKRCALTQAELAQQTGLSIRSIQLFEQKQTDISHAQYNHLKALARVLKCDIDDLIDK
ncbi:MAG: helix-turn-helix transcriptional regulator [Sphaerochaetaceae bacterium]|nr:helix-turn-helix transcriptional regulator [Sphaerochaetaceae bacterium]